MRRPISRELKPASLSRDQMRAAIPKLERRIGDLEDFDPRSITERDDPRIQALESKLMDTLAEIFGHETADFQRFAPKSLDQAGYNMMYKTPINDVVQSVSASKIRELSNLRTVVELFNEKLLDGDESPATKAKRVFGDLDLHPEIGRACGELFRNGHYSESVEAACKVLDMLVKMRSMRTEPSGTELMQLVFSPKNPILKYNNQSDESARSEQLGMMYLFAGAMLALRNPRAHGLIRDCPENAVGYLSFISMLAKSLDRASA
jgi:uncharacterized protein (TIGR02391 family)